MIEQLNVTVFSAEKCVRCNAVKRRLGDREIEYEEVRVDQDEDQASALKKRGFWEVPVMRVEKDGEVQWSDGYRPDFIDGLAS